jgi:hypothetical protein
LTRLSTSATCSHHLAYATIATATVADFWLLIFKFASGGPFAATFHARLPHVN